MAGKLLREIVRVSIHEVLRTALAFQPWQIQLFAAAAAHATAPDSGPREEDVFPFDYRVSIEKELA